MSKIKENLSFPPAVLRGCLINLAVMVFVIIAMTLSVSYQYRVHPLCRGGLGGGFPVLFVCDAGVGGSPISSWGKITLIDIPNGGIRPAGFLLDFLFYLIIAWILLALGAQIFHPRVQRRDVSWAAFIGAIYIVGLICGSLVFFSSELYDKGYARTPTANPIIIPSATPFGTMPSLITPIPTVGP